MASVHEYPVTVKWSGGREGKGSATADRSGVTNPISVPPEFQGPGDGTNPEELLTSAIASCYSITFGIIAANQKLPFESLETHAIGEVEQSGMTFVYKKITLRPKIVLESQADEAVHAKANDIAHKADQYCIVTNAVRGKVEIVLEPQIR